MRIGDVADMNDSAVNLLHRKVVDVIQQGGTCIEIDVPLELADFLGPSRKNQVLRGDRVDDIVGRHIVGLHRPLIEVDLRLENFAAIGRRQGSAVDSCELRANEILAKIEELILGKFLLDSARLRIGTLDAL